MQIPEEYKNSSLGIIPNDWEVKRLGEVFIFKNGINASKKAYGQGIKFVNTMDVLNNDSINLGKLLGSVTITKKQKNDFILSYGDVLFNRTSETRNEVGCSSVFLDTGEAVFGGFIIRAQSLGKELCEMYKKYCFKAYYIRDQITAFGNGAIRYNIGQEDLSKVLLSFPPLPQQQKIAEILGTWDEAIEKQSQLIDKLTDRKRGLMQQLLTGKKRLAGFSEEWKEVRLGEIGETFTGLTGKTKDNFGTGDPFITYMNVYNSYQINTTQMGYVCLEKGELQNLVKYGDIFFTISSETPHEVGMSSVLLDEIENTYLNSFCFGYRLYDFTAFIPEFAKYYLRSKGVRLEMYKLAQGSTRFNLSKSEVLKIKVILPSLPEQTAIANILTAADKEIELAKSKLELLRSQKSGLMQELLTGKTRVKIN